MTTTVTKVALVVGDCVCRVHDPSEEQGTIIDNAGNPEQWLVGWASGKVWIHHTTDLVLVAS